MDAVLLELHDGLVEIHRAGAHMAGSASKDSGDLFRCSLAGVVCASWAGIEDQGPHRPGIGPHIDPARRGHILAIAQFSPHQAAQLVVVIVVGQPIDHPFAASAAIQRQHQPRYLRRAAPGFQFQAKGAVPAIGDAAPMLERGEFRLPDQRAISEQAQRVRAVLRQQSFDDAVIIVLDKLCEARLRAGVALHPLDPRDQVGSQRHRPL